MNQLETAFEAREGTRLKPVRHGPNRRPRPIAR
jgi:hypothetical protein